MALPGFVRVYNRFPYPFSFQSNMTQYEIPAHATETVTVSMAVHALKQSVVRWSAGSDTYTCGVVPFGDENFEIPLTEEDLPQDELLAVSEVELDPAFEHKLVKVPTSDLMPSRRRAPNNFKVMLGEGNL